MSTQRFDIRHAPAPRESFRLLYISKSRFGGDWNSTAHTHSCTELFYCLSGEGQFYLAGQLFPVKPDDMVIVNPQVEHTELSLNASPLEYIVLGVASMEFLFSKADTNYAIFNCRENRERMVTLLHMLLAEADRSLDGCETVCQDLLEVLLIWVVRCTTLSLQLEEPGVRRGQTVSGRQLPGGRLAGPPGRDRPPEQILSGPHISEGIRHFPHHLPEPPPHRGEQAHAGQHRLQSGADQRVDGLFLSQLFFPMLPQGGRLDPQ